MEAAKRRGYRFDDFELRLDPSRLYRNDESINLPPQPLRLLEAFVSRPGETLSHDEIRDLLWPGQDADVAGRMHTCIRQIRRGLGDDDAEPTYIETVPRSGYRFLAAVSGIDAASPARRPARGWLAAGAALVAVCLAVVAMQWREPDLNSIADPAPSDFIQGVTLLDRADPATLPLALDKLRLAANDDPDFAPVQAALAEAFFQSGDATAARQHAERAIGIDPGYARGYLARARIEGWHDWDWQQAERSLATALELTPNAPELLLAAAWVDLFLGRREDAATRSMRATQIGARSASTLAGAGQIHFLVRRFDEAGELCESAVATDPLNVSALTCVYHVAFAEKDYESAKAALLSNLEWTVDSGEYRSMQASLGPEPDPLQAIIALERRRAEETPPHDSVAAAYSAVKQLRYDEAFFHLREAHAARVASLPRAMLDPLFVGLQHQAAFVALRESMGIVDP